MLVSYKLLYCRPEGVFVQLRKRTFYRIRFFVPQVFGGATASRYIDNPASLLKKACR